MENNEETRQNAADEVKRDASRTPSVDPAFTRRAEEIADKINRQISEEVESSKSGVSEADIADGETPLDQNVKLMSPMRMVLRRFFRSKLSIIGLVLILGLILFSWLGPWVCSWFGYNWGETEVDNTGRIDYAYQHVQITDTDPTTGEEIVVSDFYQVVEKHVTANALAKPSGNHWFGTDKSGRDVFLRLMYGGRISITVSFITVIAITLIGVVFGGLAGYFGGWVDNVIMRICDILMCMPTLPLLLILGTILDNPALGISQQSRIYFLMLFLTIFSWSGTARLVRGQILYLREQEYMVAAEAMGFSTGRKIFKHLVPNVFPQLIVTMTLSLGSTILYLSSLSYIGMGVQDPYADWGAMINIISQDTNILKNYFNVWGPPGICIVLAVLGFNFVGDGLRDALDPKMRR